MEITVTSFERELSSLINRHCGENASGTPDFILAAYLNDCLTAWNKAVRWRDNWKSTTGVPINELATGPTIERL